MQVTQPILGSPEPRKPQRLLVATAADQDPQAIMQENIKTKAGPGALDRVKQYLASTGDPDAGRYTKLYTDGALVYKYDLSVADWRFTETDKGGMVPELVDQKEIDNSSAATVSEQFTYSKTLTNTFTFSFTEGIKIGVSAKFKANVPFFGGGEWTVSGELSFSATQTDTETNTTTWSNTVTVNVPAHTKVRAIAFVNVGNPTYTFNATALISNGMVNIPAYDPNAKSWNDLFIPLDVLLPMPAERSIPLSGELSAQCGVRTYVEVDPIP
jgi:hypothetical protein